MAVSLKELTELKRLKKKKKNGKASIIMQALHGNHQNEGKGQ